VEELQMSGNTDILIEEKEAELLPLRSRMEQLKEEFTKETVRFASEWYRKTANQYVAKYPEVTLSLKQEQISIMKSKINELTRNTEKTVTTTLDNSVLWWHMKPSLHDSIDRYKQVGDKYPEILDRAIRQALGVLGVVLEEFRFHVTASGNTGTYQEFWFAQAVGNQHTVPYYPHLLKWTGEMQDTVREYNAIYVKAVAVHGEIQQLKEEKKRQEALKRWDSI
jgi:hypothetical protein